MSAKQKTSLLILFVFVFYFLLRTINLSLLPIFNDESTYIRYGLYELNQPDHQPYSLLIGKEPLMPYLYALFGTVFGNLLLGARWVSIIFGMLTLTGLFLFVKSSIGIRAAFFTSLFYCLAPYTVFFDRLALLDSPVSTIAVWSLYFTWLLLKKSLWWYAIGLGIVSGIGMWIKTSDLFYLFLPLISYILIYFFNGDTKFVKGKKFVSAFFISLIILLPLFFNPFYTIHMQLLRQYTYPLYSVLFFPFLVWWNNLFEIIEWLFFYLTPPLFLLAIGALIICIKQKKFSLVLLWFFLPLIYEILYAKLFASRHVLLLTIPLFIFAGYGFSLLWERKKVFAMLLGACILICSLYDTSFLLTSPQQYPSLFADKAQADMSQYVYGFSSGYGVKESVDYLEQTASTKRIIVLIRNDHGNPEDAIAAYLGNNPNIVMGLMNDPQANVAQVFQKVGTSIPVYFVARGAYNAGLEKYFASEKIFSKPNDKEFVGVAMLKPTHP
jgi:4-amino-4-deoxy-L-arabinose transferase-like glycosyltransferase